ncbi:unnamed protein product [Bursaphelenchus xylophilus]|uniref:(pine wood nematode) hypothetical protein n=1 Tax=Bursaphelenchus xylophilus TaxID=6326 RepID=A0A1I7S7X3_BURXY|nr:unnamed protein product [Bursaphelenchus xylophilus]CAG9087183.1 unnamed protein product [Bursaphelenchus xylophilus]
MGQVLLFASSLGLSQVLQKASSLTSVLFFLDFLSEEKRTSTLVRNHLDCEFQLQKNADTMSVPPGFEKQPNKMRTEFTKRLVELVPKQAPVDFVGTRRIANQSVSDKGVAYPVWNGKFGPVEEKSIGCGCRKDFYDQMREDSRSQFKHYPFCLDITLKAGSSKREGST